jgi:alpha-maltose-1-phosphate synthase
MRIAVYFHPDSYDYIGGKLMGRQMAGLGFLQGLLLHLHNFGAHSVSILLPRDLDASAVQVWRERYLLKGQISDIRVFTDSDASELQKTDVVFFPGPNFQPLQALRRKTGSQFSITGITHTTASLEAMQCIREIAPSLESGKDALICTSQAVRANVLKIIGHSEESFEKSLPVIPLGIHSQELSDYRKSYQQARELLNLSTNDIVVLFLGRLSFHVKANPLALYQALSLAQHRITHEELSLKKFVLLECGWFANEAIRAAYNQAATLACSNVRVIRLDGKNNVAKQRAWACADIFCSLVDNIQETFGISPIEAKAAGLASVVSDWNGYKETIRNGIDGFRVRTLAPSAGSANKIFSDLQAGQINYDRYCGFVSNAVAIDIEQAAQGFVDLAKDDQLRADLGKTAQQDAQARFDWKPIIGQYITLWESLSTHRAGRHKAMPQPGTGADKEPSSNHCPFELFGHYATMQTSSAPRFQATLAFEQACEKLQALLNLRMVNFANERFFDLEKNLEILRATEKTALTLTELANAMHTQDFTILDLSVCRLAKLGLLTWR